MKQGERRNISKLITKSSQGKRREVWGQRESERQRVLHAP